MSQIHWFPGHMSKALTQMSQKIKIVDVVIELFDARCPLSSINENLEEITQNKKKLIVLTKIDLADPSKTEKWKEQLSKKYPLVLTLNLNDKNAENIIAKAVLKLGEEKRLKEKAKGMKPQPIRAMIVGIPNVGKSSLINRIAARHAAGVQNKPGYTRGEQWISVNKDFLLLDTPGVLPMNYEDKEKATKLAIIGAIREDILPNTFLVDYLLKFLKQEYPNALKERFDIEEIGKYEDVMEALCKRRGLLTNGEYDFLKAESLLLNEFKNGKLGRFTLE